MAAILSTGLTTVVSFLTSTLKELPSILSTIYTDLKPIERQATKEITTAFTSITTAVKVGAPIIGVKLAANQLQQETTQYSDEGTNAFFQQNFGLQPATILTSSASAFGISLAALQILLFSGIAVIIVVFITYCFRPFFLVLMNFFKSLKFKIRNSSPYYFKPFAIVLEFFFGFLQYTLVFIFTFGHIIFKLIIPLFFLLCIAFLWSLLSNNLTPTVSVLMDASDLLSNFLVILAKFLNLLLDMYNIALPVMNAYSKKNFLILYNLIQILLKADNVNFGISNSNNNNFNNGRRLGDNNIPEFIDLSTYEPYLQSGIGFMAWQADITTFTTIEIMNLVFASGIKLVIRSLLTVMIILTNKFMCALSSSVSCVLLEAIQSGFNVIGLTSFINAIGSVFGFTFDIACGAGELLSLGVSCSNCAGDFFNIQDLGIFSNLISASCPAEQVSFAQLGGRRLSSDFLIRCEFNEMDSTYTEFINGIISHSDFRSEMSCPTFRRNLDSNYENSLFMYKNQILSSSYQSCILNQLFESNHDYYGNSIHNHIGSCGNIVKGSQIHLLKNFSLPAFIQKRRRLINNKKNNNFNNRNQGIQTLKSTIGEDSFLTHNNFECKISYQNSWLNPFEGIYDTFCATQKIILSQFPTTTTTKKSNRKLTSNNNNNDFFSHYHLFFKQKLNFIRTLNSLPDHIKTIDYIDILATKHSNQDLPNLITNAYFQSHRNLKPINNRRNLQQQVLSSNLNLCPNGQYRCPNGDCVNSNNLCKYPNQLDVFTFLRQNIISFENSLSNIDIVQTIQNVNQCFQLQVAKPETDPLSWENTVGGGSCQACTYCPPITHSPSIYRFHAVNLNLTQVILQFCSETQVADCMCTYYPKINFNQVSYGFIPSFVLQQYSGGLVSIRDMLYFTVPGFLQTVNYPWHFVTSTFSNDNYTTNLIYPYPYLNLPDTAIGFCFAIFFGDFLWLLFYSILAFCFAYSFFHSYFYFFYSFIFKNDVTDNNNQKNLQKNALRKRRNRNI